MSLIRNLIKEPEEHKPRKKKNDQLDDEEEEKLPRPIVKSATDLQRLRLEKLMKNPDKPIVIPEAPREKDYMQTVPSFVRNVMGSSAGAGSGEFHVYRHLRRKEYARQKTIQAKSIREQLDDEYQQKLDDNRRKAEEKTAKKRAKRLKRKHRAKKPREQNKVTEESTKDESSDESEQGNSDHATEKLELDNTINANVLNHDFSANADTAQNNSIETQLENAMVVKPNTPPNHENNTKAVQSSEEDVQTYLEAEKTADNAAEATKESAEPEIKERCQGAVDDVDLETTE